jgi:putative restriction endonuclease
VIVEEATEVLEACPIVPYVGPKTNHPSRIDLRADIHTLFDLGLITKDPDSMTVVVAPSLRRSDYAPLEGTRLREPVSPSFAPAAAAFEERRRRAQAK